MTTQGFLRAVENEELDESNDFIDWLGLAEMYNELAVSETQ